MNKYLIIKNPEHKQVYYEDTNKVAIGELRIASKRFEESLSHIQIEVISGIKYLTFEKSNELKDFEIDILSKLTFVFAIFKKEEINNKTYLLPIKNTHEDFVNNKISTLLKYPGKTNRLFTKMLINIALLTSEKNFDEKIRLLDPVAGRGTTLYEGIIYGFDVAGIELEKKSAHEGTSYFRNFLDIEKIRYEENKGKIIGESKKDINTFVEFNFAKSKEELRDNERKSNLKYVCGNSIYAPKYFGNNVFDILVGDLPYGIAHGNVAKKKGSSKTRTPLEFMNESLPNWKAVLKDKGVLVLAWNKLVFSRSEFVEILEKNGFEVLKSEGYFDLDHKVDNSIKRDLIVARVNK